MNGYDLEFQLRRKNDVSVYKRASKAPVIALQLVRCIV